MYDDREGCDLWGKKKNGVKKKMYFFSQNVFFFPKWGKKKNVFFFPNQNGFPWKDKCFFFILYILLIARKQL